MPDTVRLLATDDEWEEFLVRRAQPKPIMLDRYVRNPAVPHDLADDLFARIIARLSEGDLVAFRRLCRRRRVAPAGAVVGLLFRERPD